MKDLDVEKGDRSILLAKAHKDETSLPESHNSWANHKALFATLILLLGAGVTAAFLTIGITAAKKDQRRQFERRATEFMKAIETAWSDYETFGLWIHQACEHDDLSTLTLAEGDEIAGCSREEFRELYEYILSTGVEFQSAQFMPNVTHANRAFAEEEARGYYAENYEHVNYRGFTGFEPSPETGEVGLNPRSEQPFYFPVHLVEPVTGNEAALDLDLYSSQIQKETLLQAIRTWRPALTDRLKLVQDPDPTAYSVILHHPGVNTTIHPGETATGVSLMVVRVPDLIARATSTHQEGRSVFIFDSTYTEEAPNFLGGADTDMNNYSVREETTLQHLQDSSDRIEVGKVRIADREWTIAVLPLDGTFEANFLFVSLGGCIIFAACLILVVWFYTSMRRSAKITQMMAKAETEKAAIIIETAKQQATSERELNDFIAHEVRNPLSSAIAALSFVKSYITDTTSASYEGINTSVQDDLNTVDSSLNFINDLLRNMLDMHRASSKQMQITMAPADVRRDVLDPVVAMLHLRGNNNIAIQTSCPPNLFVETDPLRLKQMALNLANNSVKFVHSGFIRIRADVVNGNVRLYIEDSGSGIPKDKRDKLFNRFQESLDLLNQGTGIGLNLCKSLSNLMGGDVWLDEGYNSGVPSCPGSRFIVDLKRPPLDLGPHTGADEDATNKEAESSPKATMGVALPKELLVLFVDDDLMIRKLFLRALKRVAPGWKCDEASNGETALGMSQSKKYDLMFVDQYMASVQKQLLGSETVRAMRSDGCQATICGLSANDADQLFMEAGADCFMFKPFKCEKEELRTELLHVLQSGNQQPNRRESAPVTPPLQTISKGAA